MDDSPKPTAKPTTWKPAMLRLIHDELTAFEAKHQLGRRDSQRLNTILNQAGRQIAKGPGYRRVYDRALRIQRKKIMALAPSKRRRGGVTNPDRFEGGREVLGGLPSSRRGH